MQELISVIVPVYNVEDYIRRCIDSILNQSYKNFELLLIDDGSPDRCGDICDNYATRDNRVRVIHKINGGLSDARNVGIDIAKGSYLTFIDSDDWVHVDYIRSMYELAINRKAEIAVCGFIKTSTEVKQDSSSEVRILEFSNVEALQHLTGKLYVPLVVTWGKLYKANLFRNIRFPVGKIHEDEFTTYKLLYVANKVVYTPQVLLYYWQRSDSIMGSGFKLKNRLHAMEAYQQRADFFHTINQLSLESRTYLNLFYIAEEIYQHQNLFADDDLKKDFLNNFRGLRVKLRRSKQTLKFRLYYEFYYITPRFALLIRKVFHTFLYITNCKNTREVGKT